MAVNNTLVTLLSQVQLQQLMRTYIVSSVKELPIFKFLKSPDIFQLWQPNDILDNAKKAYDIEVNQGSVASRDSDGKPTGNNYNTSLRYENLASMENMNALYTLAFQDKRVLEAEMQTLTLIYNQFDSDMISKAQLVSQLSTMKFGQIINNKLVNAVRDKLTALFTAFIVAAPATQIFATEFPYRASAGTIYANTNIIAAEFSETSIASLLNNMVVEVDQNGSVLGIADIKHLVIDTVKVASALQIIYPDSTVDSENRTLMNAMTGEKINIVPAVLGNSNVFAFAQGHGFKCLMDAQDVVVTMKEDENGNIVINADIAIGFVFEHGNRIYLFKK